MSAVAGDEHHDDLAASLKQENGTVNQEHTLEPAVVSKDATEPVVEDSASDPVPTDEHLEHPPATITDDTHEDEAQHTKGDVSVATEDVSADATEVVSDNKDTASKDIPAESAHDFVKEDVVDAQETTPVTAPDDKESTTTPEAEEPVTVPLDEPTAPSAEPQEDSVEDTTASTVELAAAAHPEPIPEEPVEAKTEVANEEAIGPGSTATADAEEVPGIVRVAEEASPPEEAPAVPEPQEPAREVPTAVSAIEEAVPEQESAVTAHEPVTSEEPVVASTEETSASEKAAGSKPEDESNVHESEVPAASEPEHTSTVEPALVEKDPEDEPTSGLLTEASADGEVKILETDVPQEQTPAGESSDIVPSVPVETAEAVTIDAPEDQAVAEAPAEATSTEEVEPTEPESLATSQPDHVPDPGQTEAAATTEEIEPTTTKDAADEEKVAIPDTDAPSASGPDAVAESHNAAVEETEAPAGKPASLNINVQACDSAEPLVVLSASDEACLAEPTPETETSAPTTLEEEASAPTAAKEDEGIPAVAVDDAPAEPAVEQSAVAEEATNTATEETKPEEVDAVAPAAVAIHAEPTEKEVEPVATETKDTVDIPLAEESSAVATEAVPEEVISEAAKDTQDIPPESAPVVEEAEPEIEVKEAAPENLQSTVASTEHTDDVEVDEPTAASVEPSTTGLDATAIEEPTIQTTEPAEVAEETVTSEPPAADTDTEEAPAAAIAPALGESVTEEPKSEDVQQPDRPKSPWTPSYSVLTQGPGSATEEAADGPSVDTSKEEPAVVLSEATIAAAENPAESTAPAEASESWPVSYSVSTQGTSPLQTPQETQDVDVEHTTALSEPGDAPEEATVVPPVEEFVPKEPEVDIIESEPLPEAEPVITIDTSEKLLTPQIVATDEDSQIVSPVVIPDHGDDDVPPVEEVQPDPERPWTPSYSVSHQGSSPKATDAELPQPATGAGPGEKSETPERPASRGSWTPSYSVSRQGSVSSLKDAAAESKVAPEQTESASEQPTVEIAAPVPVRPSSRGSWTPSYSISRQGSRSSLKEPEAPAPAPTESDTAPQPETEIAAPVPERPVSRGSWSQSYSVSRQGSRSSLKEPAATDVQPDQQPPIIANTPALVEEPQSQESATAAPERPWTPSYSVSRQGSSPAPALKDLPSTDSAVEQPSTEAQQAPGRPWTPSYSVSRQGSSPIPSPQVKPVELAEPQQTPPERPWTPSYSVSRQGSSPLLSNAELAPVAQDVPPVARTQTPEVKEEQSASTPRINVEEVAHEAETAAPAEPKTIAADEPAKEEEKTAAPERPWTPSYSVSKQGTSPIGTPQVQHAELKTDVEPVVPDEGVKPQEPSTETKEEPAADATKLAPEQPERPWTPSYSVTTQGPGSPAQEAADKPIGEAFPTTEVHEPGPKVSTKPSLARLATLAEDKPTNVVSPAQLEETDVTSSKRSRHESNHSTASSRYFPGGWFSSNPKSPEDNRASLDHAHAQGEFSSNGKGASAAEAPANTPVEGTHQKKKHHRSCVIF